MFKLNGKDCIDPGFLKQTLQAAGFSIWWEKYSCNYFRHQVGVDPGEGYLLLKGSDVPTDSFTVPLVVGSVTVPKVVVARSVEITPTGTSTNGTSARLVHIYDERLWLQRTAVTKSYNVIKSFDDSGQPTFYNQSMKDLGGDTYTQWTWQTLLQDLWDDSLLYISTLSFADADFPEIFPMNYRFNNGEWMTRDALGKVLYDIGHTLEAKSDGTYSIRPLVTDSTFLSQISSSSSKLIDVNNLEDGQGQKLPEKLRFYFSYPEENEVAKHTPSYIEDYTVVVQHSYQSIVGNTQQAIESPIQAAYDTENPTVPLNQADLDAYAASIGPKLVKLLFTAEGHDNTYSGVINLFPSSSIGRVTWKDTGSNVSSNGTGLTTRLEHCFPFGTFPELKLPTLSSQVVVYEFRNCADPLKSLYLDNESISEHEAGEVAVIEVDGVYDCWQLIGPAPFCKTGQCHNILIWRNNCSGCVFCFYLTLCGGGSPTFVRGTEWFPYLNKTVKLDGPGHEGCYTVALADGCFDVNEDLNTTHILNTYTSCDGCGCYELTNCADDEELKYVSTNMAAVTGVSGEDAIGRLVKYEGVCYTITAFANPCGTSPEEWDAAYIQQVTTCNACCYLLTPCPEQAGDPDPAYYKPTPDDPNLDLFVNPDGTSNGRVIRLAGICFSVSVPEECPEEDVIVGLPTVEEEYDTCEDCILTCWERCDAPGTYIHTYSDLKDVGPNAVVKRAEDEYCYKRATLSECSGDPLVVITPETIIDEGEDSCEICQTPKVKLTPSCGSGCSDCEGSPTGGTGPTASTIVTDNEAFFGFVGQYIKANGICYLVSWTTDELGGEVTCWTGPYNSCQACKEAPSQITVIALVDGEHKNVTLQGVFTVCGQEALDECEE